MPRGSYRACIKRIDQLIQNAMSETACSRGQTKGQPQALVWFRVMVVVGDPDKIPLSPEPVRANAPGKAKVVESSVKKKSRRGKGARARRTAARGKTFAVRYVRVQTQTRRGKPGSKAWKLAQGSAKGTDPPSAAGNKGLGSSSKEPEPVLKESPFKRKEWGAKKTKAKCNYAECRKFRLLTSDPLCPHFK